MYIYIYICVYIYIYIEILTLIIVQERASRWAVSGLRAVGQVWKITMIREYHL